MALLCSDTILSDELFLDRIGELLPIMVLRLNGGESVDSPKEAFLLRIVAMARRNDNVLLLLLSHAIASHCHVTVVVAVVLTC